jgi:glycosyltransferase involved in cell wall biosynthesis
VLLYASASWPFAPRLIRFCRRRWLPLVADVTERYGPGQFPRGLLDIRFYLFSFVFSAYFRRIRHMVVASRHLECYFRGKGCRTLRIPALVDCASIAYSGEPEGGRLRLIYAGSPGRKDLVARALDGLLMLTDAELECVTFDLFGPSEEWLAAQFGGVVPGRLRNIVRAHGRVPSAEVSERLLKADFTVLLREDRRFTRAGFPSKVAESLAHGLPLLANMTGDMGMYLRDGLECIEVTAPTAESFAGAMRRALALPPEKLAEMRRAARSRAEADFDYRNRAGALDALVRNACAEWKGGAAR